METGLLRLYNAANRELIVLDRSGREERRAFSQKKTPECLSGWQTTDFEKRLNILHELDLLIIVVSVVSSSRSARGSADRKRACGAIGRRQAFHEPSKAIGPRIALD